MSRSRNAIILLIAVGLLAMIAAAGAAAAEPAFYECAKVREGAFEKGCTVEGAGGFELEEGIGKKGGFSGKGGSITFHIRAMKFEMKCGSFKDEGELTSPTTEGKVVATFSKCGFLGKTCNSAGQKKGTIETNDLDGELGYISKSAPIVGVDLKAEGSGNIAEFECEGLLTVKMTGSVIGEQKGDINVFSKSWETKYEVVAEEQKYRGFEGGPEDVLLSEVNGAGPYASGLEATAVNKGEELEIKA